MSEIGTALAQELWQYVSQGLDAQLWWQSFTGLLDGETNAVVRSYGRNTDGFIV
jgi:hypothetical protein